MKKQRNFQFTSTSNQTVTPLRSMTSHPPVVFYTREVEAAIEYIVDKVSSEVGWFGLVEELPSGDYLITDLFIPKQIVTGTTVDMAPDAVADMAHLILELGKDPGNLRYQGHSHVNMGVNPSGTDEDMVDDFLADCPYFIRGIYNKAGESRVDVFDREQGLVFNRVWAGVEEPPLSPEFYHMLDEELRANLSRPAPRVLTTPLGHFSNRPAAVSTQELWADELELIDEEEDAHYTRLYGPQWRDAFFTGDP